MRATDAVEVAESGDLRRTLFVVSSKSGSTLEPNIFFQYFWAETLTVIAQDTAGFLWVATQEGIFRKHMIMADGHVRDSVYFSIVDTDWPL